MPHHFYVPELLPGSAPALRNHQDVFDIIRLFKARPNTKRSQLTQEYFSKRDKPPPPADQHRAFNLAVRIMSMVKCSADNQPSGLLELGTQPIQWHSNNSLVDFMAKVFPQADTGNLHVRDDSGRIRDIKSTITARRLKKVARLRFQGTDDLRNHLKMDVKEGVVEIFHCTSVLKEHLLAHPDLQESMSAGNIPRQVALEVLDSLQNVLFPFDSTSEQILRDLVSKQSFDPDCLHYDAAVYRGEGEGDLSYSYFGSRLVDLFEELEDPSPRGILETWFQRRDDILPPFTAHDEDGGVEGYLTNHAGLSAEYTQAGLAREFDNMHHAAQDYHLSLPPSAAEPQDPSLLSWQPQELVPPTATATEQPWQASPLSWSQHYSTRSVWQQPYEAGLGQLPPTWELSQGTARALQHSAVVQTQPHSLPRRRSRTQHLGDGPDTALAEFASGDGAGFVIRHCRRFEEYPASGSNIHQQPQLPPIGRLNNKRFKLILRLCRFCQLLCPSLPRVETNPAEGQGSGEEKIPVYILL
ncbi:hypothetical protein CEP52_005670 [Fusarium oligoseptatum]|uniref:Uncharacterized protein n=1 Tax=Fusarium oligoseptatum TaxID=2604345 RepID=A0A428TWV3_9HYPO|nr:hypothetical protein CEP52_005670 [Fusarium oligoseptatum]